MNEVTRTGNTHDAMCEPDTAIERLAIEHCGSMEVIAYSSTCLDRGHVEDGSREYHRA